MRKTVGGIVVARIIGLIVLLIALAVVNMLVPSIDNEVYSGVVSFFNDNILLLIGLMVVGMINDILWSFYLPFNLLAPITGSVFGVLVLAFVYRFWLFFETYVNIGFEPPIRLLYALVFVFTLLFGYLTILARAGRPRYELEEGWKEMHARKWEEKDHMQARVENKLNPEETIHWSDIGNEFKMAFFNVGRRINRKLEGNGKENKDSKDTKDTKKGKK